MKEKLSGAVAKCKEFFGKMTKKVKIILGVSLLAIVALAVIVAAVLNNRPYEVLFTGLASDEAASIMSYLEENGATDYRLENNDTILVPKSQEPMLKAKLLMANYPKSGFGYESYFTHASTLSTDQERETALLIALQDRMAAVIRCLDGVKDANVTIAAGEDRRYVLDSSNMVNASASVQVTMQGGYALTNQQATAIRNLVSHAVKGLDIENITITDSLGNMYSGGEGASAGEASQLKLQLEEEVNNKLRTNILQVLTPLYGEENVRVAVNSTVDINRTVGETTAYARPEGSVEGAGIIGSRVYDREVVRPNEENAGGAVGTTTNASIPTYVQNQTQMQGDESYIRDSGEDNFHVNTSREQVERVAGIVSDVTVAVSINSTAAGGVNANNLRDHIARAAGITIEQQMDKISIMAQPFYDSEEQNPDKPGGEGLVLPPWAIYAAAGGGVLFFVLLLLIILLLKKKNKKKQQQLEEAELEQPLEDLSLTPQAGADIMDLQTEKSMELRKDVRQFASENPEIAAQMIKNWLKGGEKENG